jgi:multidrug efflux pump subunit AcrA (membrane-fusion protein)
MRLQAQRLFWSAAVALAFLLASCSRQEATSPVRKNLNEAVFASGHVEQANNYTVSAKAEGILLSVPVKEGDSVATDDVIATIEDNVQKNQLHDARVLYNDAIRNASPESPQLQSLETQIEQAQQQIAFDEENYLRHERLREQETVSQLELEKAELQFKSSQSNLIALQKNLNELKNAAELSVQRSRVQVNTQEVLMNDYTLVTKESGRVVRLFKKAGELVRRGEAVAQIGSGPYIIRLYVAEDDITKVSVGHSVALRINTHPGRTFSATISRVFPAFDDAEQSYVVEALFDQMPQKMFAGTKLQANIRVGRRTDVLVIPTAFVRQGSTVLLENGEERHITTGSRNSEWTEILSGIAANDVIVKSRR